MSNGFNFEASTVVSLVKGLGEFTEGKGYSHIEIHGPGLRYPVTIAVKNIMFILSDKVDTGTFSPCYDEKEAIMAFPSENSIVWHFQSWQIHLDLIIREDEENQAKDTMTLSAVAA